jgi:hypothetical protein
MQRQFSIILGRKKKSMNKLYLFPTFRKCDACHYQQQIVNEPTTFVKVATTSKQR